MKQTFTVQLSPNTIVGADFIAELPASRKFLSGRFVTEQTFIDTGAVKTIAGELVSDPFEWPVLGNYDDR